MPSITKQNQNFKYILLALLTINVFIYAFQEKLIITLNAFAWLLLLIMFELEVVKQQLNQKYLNLHLLRNILIGFIALLFFAFIYDNDWLEVINSLLWFLLIALMELEIRWTNKVQPFKRGLWITTVFTFIALLIIVFIWISRSAWLDAYDALLWIISFAVLDVDILKFLRIKNL